jgi:hypothetical protein
MAYPACLSVLVVKGRTAVLGVPMMMQAMLIKSEHSNTRAAQKSEPGRIHVQVPQPLTG